MTKKEIEALANDINEEVADIGVDEAKVCKEYDDYRVWYVIEEAPDLDKLYEETIVNYCNNENLTIIEEEKLREELDIVRYYETDLEERVFDKYSDNWRD